jgi:hypothetical protein
MANHRFGCPFAVAFRQFLHLARDSSRDSQASLDGRINTAKNHYEQLCDLQAHVASDSAEIGSTLREAVIALHLGYSVQLEAKLCGNAKLKGLGRKTLFAKFKSEFDSAMSAIEPMLEDNTAHYVLPAFWAELAMSSSKPAAKAASK